MSQPQKMIWACVASMFIVLWHGFALSILWGWFMVPQFGLPEIDTVTASGIVMLVTLPLSQFNMDMRWTEKESDQYLMLSLLYRTITPAAALLLGAILHALA